MQQLLAAEAIKSGFLDRIYWESYQSNPDLMTGDAMSILSTISDFNGNKGDRRVLLAFETNCCAKPCLDPGCYSCGTKPLPDWELKSFGLCQGRMDPMMRAQRVEYLLDTLDSVEMHLAKENMLHVMDRNATTGFVAYNYRCFKILLDHVDNGTEACPSGKKDNFRGGRPPYSERFGRGMIMGRLALNVYWNSAGHKCVENIIIRIIHIYI